MGRVRFRHTLGFFLFSRVLMVAFGVFAVVLATTTGLYERLLERQARTTAAGIARQTHAAIRELMLHGPSREELARFLAAIKRAQGASPYGVDVFRGPAVVRQYGAGGATPADPAVREVIVSARPRIVPDRQAPRYLFPLRAAAPCLPCHACPPGTVLGVVEVRQSLPALSSRMRARYSWLFLGYGLLVLAAGSVVTWLVVRRVTGAVQRFRDMAARVRSVADLSTLQAVTAEDLDFVELNHAGSAMAELAERLHRVAVDRDVLEFQMELLGKFIITSSVLKDWQRFVKDFLLDINAILPAYFLLTCFQERGAAYEVNVFWRAAPTDRHRRWLDELLRERIGAWFAAGGTVRDVRVGHHDCGSAAALPESLSGRSVSLHVRHLTLDTPKVDGVVVLGCRPATATSPVAAVLVGSVLSTLHNLVGSVQAIANYTRELEFYATRDPLTRLHNQRMFWELIEYEIRRADRHGYHFALLLIDMDDFKAVNDRYGHAFGDFFLQQFADVLRSTVRDGDLVARYAGDEFTVLLPETDQEAAMIAARRINDAVARLAVPARDGGVVRTTISIGVALFPDHARTAKDLFLVADSLLYKVKGRGKNEVARPEADDLAELFQWQGEVGRLLGRALERQVVVPYFQPVVDLGAGALFGHELLMRIPAEDGSLLPAASFIATAAQGGMLSRLDRLLLDRACQAIRAHGYGGRLFVNLAPELFLTPGFFSLFHELFQRNGIAPERIVVEVNEREVVQHVGAIKDLADTLRAAGYLFAIDDFGAGYPALHYLNMFAIDFIKIGGDFVRGMAADRGLLAYTKSIVTLARELGVRTIAKSVENEAVLGHTVLLGIEFGQGDCLGRPAAVFADLAGTAGEPRTEGVKG